MDRSTPGFPVHHQLPELTQTHAHRVSDAIQPSHLLLSPSPPAFNLAQHQGLFQWVSSSHQVVKVLEFQLQHQSFQWTPRTDLLQDGLVGSPCSPRASQESSPAPQFKSINSSELSFLYVAIGVRISFVFRQNDMHIHVYVHTHIYGYVCIFPGGLVVNNPPANAGDPGLISGSGISPGERNGNPLQYTCLENSMDWRAWWATAYRVDKSQTWLSN